jgi:hypothetical protein
MHKRVPPRGGFRIAEGNRQTEAAGRGSKPRKAAFSVHRDDPADRGPVPKTGGIGVRLAASLRASRTGLIIDTSIVGNMRKTAVTELPSTGGAGTDREAARPGITLHRHRATKSWGCSSAGRASLSTAEAARSNRASSTHGLLAHLEERLPCKQKVRGFESPAVHVTGSRKTVIHSVRDGGRPGSTPGGPTGGEGDGNPPVLGTGQTQFDSAVSGHGSLAEMD